MKIGRLTLGDIRFQWKYGFYFVYAVFTALYLLALCAVPEGARCTVAAVLIFTDPAAMGLFFMGAIVLLEKSQHVNCALAVAPVSVWEYCAGKLLSLALIGLLVAMALAAAGGVGNLLSCLAGVFFASLLCSGCGLIAAMRCRTLNQFILLAVPFEILICVPPALLLFGVEPPLLWLHPGAAAVALIFGSAAHPLGCLLVLALWCLPAIYGAGRAVRRNFLTMGGAAI